ncbi:MAG: hydrogenase maturation protease [Candidatus Njordarchaeia archaeon]
MFIKKLEKVLLNCRKLAIVAVGNPLFGEDAAAIYLVKKLEKHGVNADFYYAEQAPENVLSKFLNSEHTHLLIFDAADFGGKLGELRLIEHEELPDETITTHTVPLKLMVRILAQKGLKVAVVGIQIQEIGFFELTKELKEILDKHAELIANILSEKCGDA